MTNTQDEQRRINEVEGSQYFQFLEFAIDKALGNEEFTIKDVEHFFPKGASEKQITNRLPNLCHHRQENVDHYEIRPEAFLAYLEFLSLQDSQRTARKADKRAAIAIWIAIASLALNLIVGIISFSLPQSPTAIAESQIEKLDVTQELRSIETAIKDAQSTGSSERSEMTSHLMSPRRIDESQVQKIIEAINRPAKLDESQLNDIQENMRQVLEKKDEVPNNPNPKASE